MLDAIDASSTPIERLDATYDVVVTNLGGTRAVVGLAGVLAARVAPGGALVVSGMLDGADEPALEALRAHGLVAMDRRTLDGWVAVLLRR
jgi:ribosomal protein L11 methyltransferase